MKKQNLKKTSPDLPSKIQAEKFLQQRPSKIEKDGSVLDEQYICDDSERKVTLTTALTGKVIGSNAAVYLDGVQIESGNPTVLGNNKDLNNRKLKIIQNVFAETGTSCVFSAFLKGGYKDIMYRLISKTGENGLIFTVYIEFI